MVKLPDPDVPNKVVLNYLKGEKYFSKRMKKLNNKP